MVYNINVPLFLYVELCLGLAANSLLGEQGIFKQGWNKKYFSYPNCAVMV